MREFSSYHSVKKHEQLMDSNYFIKNKPTWIIWIVIILSKQIGRIRIPFSIDPIFPWESIDLAPKMVKEWYYVGILEVTVFELWPLVWRAERPIYDFLAIWMVKFDKLSTFDYNINHPLESSSMGLVSYLWK